MSRIQIEADYQCDTCNRQETPHKAVNRLSWREITEDITGQNIRPLTVSIGVPVAIDIDPEIIGEIAVKEEKGLVVVRHGCCKECVVAIIGKFIPAK